MNDQLNNAITEVIKLGKDGAVQAASFLGKQAPELAKEIVVWGIASNIVKMVIGLVCLILGIWACKFGTKIYKDDLAKKEMYCAHEGAVMLWTGSGIFMLISGGILISGIFYTVQAYFAPRLYVINYVASLIHPAVK